MKFTKIFFTVLFLCAVLNAAAVMKIEVKGDNIHYVFTDGEKEVAREVYDGNMLFTGVTGKIPDGTYKDYHPGIASKVNEVTSETLAQQKFPGIENGKVIRYEYIYKGGQRVMLKKYSPEGYLLFESEFKAGLLDGITKTYYKDRIPMGLITYKKGKKEGIQISYHLNGKIEYQETYKEDVLNGTKKTLFADGTPDTEETYKDGTLNGPWRKYWENGKLKGETVYKKGAPEGLFKSYHENGKLETEAHYKEGMLDGILRVLEPDGKVKSEELYKEDKLIKKIK